MKVIKREIQDQNIAPLRAIQAKPTRLALHLSEGLTLLDCGRRALLLGRG